MSTITTIQSSDVIANSRDTINTNFSNLNTDKAESSTVTAHTGATSGVHGVTGSVVGTSDTQTLTNKTLTSPTITNKSSTGTDSGVETLANKTLTTPTIASFANATHNHQNAAGGGALDAAAITTGTIATARLGSGTANSSVFLRGDQTWAAQAGASMKCGNTTKDASDASTTQTIAHGLGTTPKFVRIKAMAIFSSGNNTWMSAEAVYNGTTQSSLSVYPNTTGSTAVTTSFILNVNGAAGPNTQVGVITFDSTNISIAWTKTGSPSGTYSILWEAYA